MNIQASIQTIKQQQPRFSNHTAKQRNKALEMVAKSLANHAQAIIKENQKDVEIAKKENLPSQLLDRLHFDEHKIETLLQGIDDLMKLKDPLHQILLQRELDESLLLTKRSVPIGMIGVIFESRPDALVQIASLALKSGNNIILKGGSEAKHTNRILFDLIVQAVKDSGIHEDWALLLDSREDFQEILSLDQEIDLLIPRGSNRFVRYLMDNTKIPVMGHSSGICHLFIDHSAEFEMALSIIYDAKTQYVAACNALESVLVHRSIAKEFLPKLYKMAKESHIGLHGTKEVMEFIDVKPIEGDNPSIEYVDYEMSVFIVEDVEQAIMHINTYGSHHTDGIITQDSNNKETFFNLVDSAGVYHNCSTRFADGYRYGFSAEVGISTGKLHARGPVGVDGLLTYKYTLEGKGQIVDDYVSGKKSFHVKDIQ